MSKSRSGTAPARLPALAAALCLAASLGVGACADDEREYVERPAEDIYDEAVAELESGNESEAAGLFDEVERQHPYSEWATRAQLMAAYSHYEALEYDEAVVALDRFIRLHPGSEDTDYAYYLRALCYYERISDVERDQRMTVLALDALQEVVNRFPDSVYARDASLKLDLAYDQLAGKEMEIGRWYLRQGHYNAAINRFRTVVEQFQTTSHVPEALHRLTEAYLSLGLREEAQVTAAVLGYNYPGSEWYQDSYADLVDPSYRPPDDDQGWLSSIF
ncbi:MAG: outer membrane protein assembly factor BamD [Rhodospirillaceae bacterium]|nr:outer membrane protein assembly factor BamD [Rhodospirillaceae bacterium]